MEKIPNHSFNISNKFAHVLFLSGLLISVLINIYAQPNASVDDWIEICGTIVQLALPFYCSVPLLVKKDFQGIKIFLLMLVICLGITYTLKYSVPILRPNGGPKSFPSGHTMGAFIGISFLTYRYSFKYLLWTLPLGLFVGFSRVHSRWHWWTDVAGSILIAFVVGYFLIKRYQKQTN